MPPQETVNLITNALKEQGIYSANTLAYALATIEHETAGTFQPIKEFGGPQQARKLGYGGGENYYGRGYIQLTHDYNYADIGRKIGLGDELVKNPDLALRPDIAAKILAVFFKDRGVAAAADRGDFVAARRGVNGTDRANLIASKAQGYLNSPTLQQTVLGASSGSRKDTKPMNTWESLLNKFAPRLPQAQASSLPQYKQPSQNTNAYTVQSGDTLWGIAQRTLGSGNRYPELGYKGDPRNLAIGTVLNVPNYTPAPKPTTSYMAPKAPTPYQVQKTVSSPTYTAPVQKTAASTYNALPLNFSPAPSATLKFPY